MTAPLQPIPGQHSTDRNGNLTPQWLSWFYQLQTFLVGSVAGSGGTGLVPTSRNINTTAPLTGGGSLVADLTLALNQAGITIAESQVTNLVTDLANINASLALKAPLASPALTGTPKINGVAINTGNGNPNGVVTGSPGDLYLNTAGGAGTTLYVKESGTATTAGWVGK